MNQNNSISQSDIQASIQRAASSLQALAGSHLFITGGTGFIGRWLLTTLLEANKEKNLELRITALTRSPDKFTNACPELAKNPALTLVRADIKNFDFPTEMFTHVIHAATDTNADAESRALELMDTIIGGTRRVLEFAKTQSSAKVLFLSSGAIYGEQSKELASISEVYPGACTTTSVRSSYGQAKRMAEQLCTVFHAQHGLETRIARCFSFVGPYMSFDGHFAIGNFIRDAVNGQPINIKGDGTPIRSYLYGADTSSWLLRILVEGRAGGVYNVGSDEALSLSELAHRVAKNVPTSNGVAIEGQPNSSSKHSKYIPDIKLARDELHLDVWTSLDESIRSTAQWLHQQRRQ